MSAARVFGLCACHSLVTLGRARVCLACVQFQDVSDSQARVAFMQAALHAGNYLLAIEYAITQEERDEVGKAQAEVQQALASFDGSESERAALRVQAIQRGKLARERHETAKVEKAATRVQALARGHISRDQQQEERRTEWLKYYASEGQYDKAMELAVSQREVDALNALKRQAAATVDVGGTCFAKCFRASPPPDDDDDDDDEVVAVATPLAASQRAPPSAAPPVPPPAKLGLPVDAKPAAAAAPSPTSAHGHVANGGVEPSKSPSKSGPFAEAIKAHEWARAATLADGPVEQLDLSESHARVEWMDKHTAAHRFDAALELAITQAETDAILAAERAAYGAPEPA